MKNVLFYITIIFLFSSCEKDITLDLPAPKDKIVVEGYIEEGQKAIVYLTNNTSYFNPISVSDLENLAITNAEVIVSDGFLSETLQLVYDSAKAPYYKYEGNTIVGEVGKTYTLKIKVDGKVLTSKTRIPNSVQVDSLTYKVDQVYLGDTLGTLWFYFNDPDTLGNYYRMSTKVLGSDKIFYPPYSSVSDDKLINGKDVVPFSTYRGRDPLEEFKQEEFYKWFFKIGDTIVFKFASMEAKTYLFWYSFEMGRSSGGPFSSPITLQSNIEGGSGIWGGYGISLDTLIVTRDIIKLN